MRTKRYIKDIILEIMGKGEWLARDLVDEVSERVGEPFSARRIGSYLGRMFVDGEVQREAVMVSSALRRYSWKRYKWFRKR
jgi:hypothetical protein